MSLWTLRTSTSKDQFALVSHLLPPPPAVTFRLLKLNIHIVYHNRK